MDFMNTRGPFCCSELVTSDYYKGVLRYIREEFHDDLQFFLNPGRGYSYVEQQAYTVFAPHESRRRLFGHVGAWHG